MSGTPTPSTPTSHVAHLQPLLAFLQQQPYGTHRKTWEVMLCQLVGVRKHLASLHITLPPPLPSPSPACFTTAQAETPWSQHPPSENLLYKTVYCSYSSGDSEECVDEAL